MTSSADFDDSFRDRLAELLTWRRDVRLFRPDPVPADLTKRIVGSVRLAPSVGLSEPWRIVVVETPARRLAAKALFEEANAEALAGHGDEESRLYARLKLAGFEAPVHLAMFADHATTQGRGLGRGTMPETIDYSVAMAIHTMWLVARAEGVGLGWVSILDPVRLTAILDVPASWRFIGYLCLGYPQEFDRVPTLEREGWERRADGGPPLFVR